MVGFLVSYLLDFHILVVEFFGGIKQFVVEIPPYQKWVFGIYVLIILSFIIGWAKALWYNKKHE